MIAATPTWLVDRSAYVRLGDGPDAPEWAERIERGLVRIAIVTRLELGFSARSAAELGGLTVLHVDKDFDLIAEVTGQPMERLAA